METRKKDSILKYILVFIAAALAVLGQNIELYHGSRSRGNTPGS